MYINLHMNLMGDINTFSIINHKYEPEKLLRSIPDIYI
jgi:hypothetical protein